MGFSRQEYWSGLQFPSPEDLPHPGTGPTSPALAVGFFTTEPPGKPDYIFGEIYKLILNLHGKADDDKLPKQF